MAMVKNYTFLYIMIVAATFLSGCKEEEDGSRRPSLNESEQYFDHTLASVSPDGDNICLIGNETGDIYRYDKTTRLVTDTLSTGTDRIYKVVVERTAEGTFYWAGIRNSGLHKYKYDKGALVLQKIYRIPQKHNRYSAYDIIFCGDYIYVSTSHGLFRKNIVAENDNLLEQVYPVRKGRGMFPMQTGGMLRQGRYIYMPSDSGLIKYDTGAGKVAEIMHKGYKVSSVAAEKGEIHSLAGSTLYIDNPANGNGRQYDIGIDTRVFYAANDTYFFINDDRITLARKEDIGNTDKYKTVMLRRNVRTDCLNIVTCDSTLQQTLLVTENALFCIPYHLDVFCADGISTAACAGEDGEYFVVNNYLFFKKDVSNEARKLVKLPKTDLATEIIVRDNTLYYINGKMELKRKRLTGSYILNSMTGNPETIYRTQRVITAIGMDSDKRVYIGIRDSLMIYEDGKAKSVEIADAPYINRFVNKGDTIYITTLNNGIYYGKEKKIQPLGNSRNYSFIRDLAFAAYPHESGNKPYILTNHFVYSPEGKDSVGAEGFSRLLTADGKTFYAVMEHGVRIFRTGTEWNKEHEDIYPDIKFSPALSFTHGGNVYIGASSLGIMEMDAQGKTARWVKFNHSVYTFDYKSLLFILIILAMAAGFVYWYRKKEKMVNELCIEIDGVEELTEKKNYMLYAEYDSICKKIENVNPQYAKELTCSGPRDRDTMEKLLQTGKIWLARYREVKKVLETYCKITELRNYTVFFGEELRKDIEDLQSRLKRRNFKIEECMVQSGRIRDMIINMDIRQTEEETRKRYGLNKDVIDSIDNDFGTRMEEDFGKAGTGFGSMDEVICWFKKMDMKWNFIDTVAKISEITKKTKDAGISTEDIKNKIKAIRKDINNDMIEMYYILSYDRTLAEAIGIKRHKQIEDISLSNKERALLLMISAPETNWNTIGAILDRGSIANIRSTYSKIRNGISSIDEDTRSTLTAAKDSLGAYILKTAGKRR